MVKIWVWATFLSKTGLAFVLSSPKNIVTEHKMVDTEPSVYCLLLSVEWRWWRRWLCDGVLLWGGMRHAVWCNASGRAFSFLVHLKMFHGRLQWKTSDCCRYRLMYVWKATHHPLIISPFSHLFVYTKIFLKKLKCTAFKIKLHSYSSILM